VQFGEFAELSDIPCNNSLISLINTVIDRSAAMAVSVLPASAYQV
jgi:hypothetical protein